MSFGHAFNVRAPPFLAKGDWNEAAVSGTDDTLAFQAAIDAAAPLGCPVFVTPGIYNVTQRPGKAHAVELKTGTKLIGIGRPTIRISDDARVSSTDLYNCFCGYGGAHDILIEGICFKGNNSPYVRSQFNGANSAVMFRGHLEGGGLSPNYNCVVRNCEFTDLHGFSGHGLNEDSYDIIWDSNVQRRMSNGLNLNCLGQITNNVLEDCQGIEHASEHILIANNRLRRVTNNGISVAGTGNQLDGITISGNIIESVIPSDVTHSAIGIAVGAGARNVLITNNQIHDADYLGLIIHNAGLDPELWPTPEGIIVDGLVINTCTNQGIYLKDNVRRISLSNCIVTNPGQHALYAFNVDGLVLGVGNYWRTGNVSEADVNFYADAKNVKIHESNDFRRRSSIIDSAAMATARWY